MQLVFDLEQLVALALHQLGDRDAGGTGHHLGNLLGADFGTQQLRPVPARRAFFRRTGFSLLELGLELGQLPVLNLGDLVELALALQVSHLGAQLVNLFLDGDTALHGRFLGLPYLVKVGIFLSQARDFLLDQLQALL